MLSYNNVKIIRDNAMAAQEFGKQQCQVFRNLR